MAVVGKLIKKSIAFRKKAVLQQTDKVKQQHNTFKKLIKKAAQTEFGKKYLFEQILTATYDIALFQKVVPIYTYEKINLHWWRRMRRGDADVCWPGTIKYFALSSGTSDGTSKYIPVSKNMIKSIRKTSLKQIYSMANYDLPESVFEKEILMIGGSTALEEKNEKYFGDMSGISAACAMPNWFIKQYYKPGIDISQMKDWNERVDAIVKNAHKWDIGIICGIPNWVQLVIEKIINHYKLKSIHDIWPNLKIYVHGGVFFEPYKDIFKTLLGEEIIYAETYMASEGYFGFTQKVDAAGIKLMLTNGIFYEFIPFNENNFDEAGNLLHNAKVYTIQNIKAHVEYAVLLSNNSGAWRYLIGDTIKFVDTDTCEIKITGRTKQYLSVCDEHISVDNIVTALQHVCSSLHIQVPEFTVIAEQEDNAFYHKWYLGSNSVLSTKVIAEHLDKQLKKINDDYKTVRNSMLGMPKIELVSVDFFYEWMRSNGKDGNQYKIPRIMQGAVKESWMHYVETALHEHKV